jgi:3-carboxy-cis,cis-muconate cycloisomerase
LPSDDGAAALDEGLLEPVAAGSAETVTDSAVLAALLDAERALVAATVAVGAAPQGVEDVVARAALEVRAALSPAALALEAVGGGNPVIPLVTALRDRTAALDAGAAVWVHRGATSQDIVDSALALVATAAARRALDDLGVVERELERLARRHRGTIAVARTLGQHSTPTTYGLRFAGWLRGVREARVGLTAAARLPAQLGGASGTLASFVALYGPETAAALPAAFAAELGLEAPPAPWHTWRAPFTRLGDALVTVVDALAVVAGDVALLARSETAELAEPSAAGRGGSSTMPHKRNPVLSVLIRSAALRAPSLAADLHRAAADALDERPGGAWHAEWPVLRELLRSTLGATAVAADLLSGLEVDAAAAAARVDDDAADLVSERKRLTGDGGLPADYLGLAEQLVDRLLDEPTDADS